MRSDFVANASHELRTPLAAILGYVETLQDMNGDADAPTRRSFLSIIHREAGRMQQLVIDLPSNSRVKADRVRRQTTTIDSAAMVQTRSAARPGRSEGVRPCHTARVPNTVKQRKQR